MTDAAPDPALTYSSYLKVDELLSLQQPRAAGPEHDEMLFIVIHQVYELWFKELLHELDRVAHLLTNDEPHRAQHTLKRILTILKVMVAQLDILETMTPLEFLTFRERLQAASGFQSDQFRQIEFVLGHKTEKAVVRFADGSRARAALQARFTAPTLWDAFLQYLAREGYAVPSHQLTRDVRSPLGRSPEVQQILIDIYRRDPKNAELCERLVDLDEGMQEWRYRHIKMVERTIGARPGTGGSTGAAYLRTTLGHNLFPDLWEIRAQLWNPLAPFYSRFRVTERTLLTGHSYQAWPDDAFEGQQRAWLDAATLVDDKWDQAAVQAGLVRAGFAWLLGDQPDNIALGQNTHELVTRWLSALPLARRRQIVSTDGEFHSLRRQLDRLAEDGTLSVVKVPARPVESLVERIGATIADETACVLVSSVLFDTAEIVPGLDRLAGACERRGVELLIDAYHHLNVVPFDLRGLESAFVTGGGYKYCQLGEGNAFLRVPPGCTMRPVLTGWFAEFEALEESSSVDAEESRAPRVSYGRGAPAFAGATYDPTSHYRAAAVFAFHARHQLTPAHLREINVRQVALLNAGLDALDLPPSVMRVEPLATDRRGGFLAIHAPRAIELVAGLRQVGVYADARGQVLRLGPAPYVDDAQLRDAVAAIATLASPRRG